MNSTSHQTPPEPSPSDPAPPDSRPARNRLAQYGVLLFFLALVLLPVLGQGCSGEAAKWKAARALHAFDQGRTDQALAWMREAAQQRPDDVYLLTPLVQMLLKANRPDEALEIAERIQQDPEFSQLGYQLADPCLIRLGRFDEALEAFRKYEPAMKAQETRAPEPLASFFGTPDLRLEYRSSRLNDFAYHRALAGKELDEARLNIQGVIDELSQYPWYPLELRVSFVDRVVISAALIGRQVGHTEPALKRIDARIEGLENTLESMKTHLTSRVTEDLVDQFPLAPTVEKWHKRQAFGIAYGRQQLAALLVIRALLLDDLGRDEWRDRDRVRVIRLGHDPDKLLKQFPDDIRCLKVLQQGAAYLDTRAVVLQKLDDLDLAWNDIQIAVTAVQILNETFGGGIQNSVSNSAGDFFDEDTSRRSEAALLYHRMLLAEQMGNQDLAESDRQRIRELGFKPGPGLN